MACQDCHVELKDRPRLAVNNGWACSSCFKMRLKAPDGK